MKTVDDNTLGQTESLIYEDELPEDLDDETYSRWFDRSVVVDGIRMGPPIESLK